jgi:hypothetical protein
MGSSIWFSATEGSRSRRRGSTTIRELLTSSAGTYMVTISQFTPSGSSNTSKRIDRMTAFAVSISARLIRQVTDASDH